MWRVLLLREEWMTNEAAIAPIYAVNSFFHWAIADWHTCYFEQVQAALDQRGVSIPKEAML
jgi:hypothetical protein